MLNMIAASSVPSSGLMRLKAFKSEDTTPHSDKDLKQLEYEKSLTEHQLKLARRQIEQLQAQLADAKAATSAETTGDSFPLFEPQLSSSISNSNLFGSFPNSISGVRQVGNPLPFDHPPYPSTRRPSSIGGSDRAPTTYSHPTNIFSTGNLLSPTASISGASAFSLPGGTYLGSTPGVNFAPHRSPSTNQHGGFTSTPGMRHSFSGISINRNPPAIPALHSHFNYGIPQPGEDMLSEPADNIEDQDRSEVDALDAYASELGLDSVTEQGHVEALQAEIDRLNCKLQLEDAGKLDMQKRIRELEDENSGLRRQVDVLKGRLRGQGQMES